MKCASYGAASESKQWSANAFDYSSPQGHENYHMCAPVENHRWTAVKVATGEWSWEQRSGSEMKRNNNVALIGLLCRHLAPYHYRFTFRKDGRRTQQCVQNLPKLISKSASQINKCLTLTCAMPISVTRVLYPATHFGFQQSNCGCHKDRLTGRSE